MSIVFKTNHQNWFRHQIFIVKFLLSSCRNDSKKTKTKRSANDISIIIIIISSVYYIFMILWCSSCMSNIVRRRKEWKKMFSSSTNKMLLKFNILWGYVGVKSWRQNWFFWKNSWHSKTFHLEPLQNKILMLKQMSS